MPDCDKAVRSRPARDDAALDAAQPAGILTVNGSSAVLVLDTEAEETVLNATTATRSGIQGHLASTANRAAVDDRQICRFSIGRRVTTIPVRLRTRLSWSESAFRADAVRNSCR